MMQFYGKYEGIVEQNFDPLGRGRLLVRVPAVFHDGQVWALPCVPYAGPGIGFFMMPPQDAHVWIEFAGGDPNRAIWSGCFWAESESAPVPASSDAAKMKMLKTDVCTITLDDSPNSREITIETTDNMKIILTVQGVEISNGKGASIKLSNNKVSINGNALEVE
jgi:uncharacterized protein involved in type VI secretion and phage assembly